MQAETIRHRFRRKCRRIAVAAAAAAGLILVGPSSTARAQGGPADPLAIAHYNVQFLFPSFFPSFIFDAFDHFPPTTGRAELIGKTMACQDIVSFNEVSNDERRADLFAAMEANAAACGTPARIDGGARFWDFFVGPHNGQTNPVLDDEIAIASRFPIVQTHTLVYEDCSGVDCLADKGALHARVWRGSGFHGRDALDVFVTHSNDGDAAVLQAQFAELRDFIKANHDPEIPVVVMGDFNTNGNPGEVSNPSSLYNTMIATLREAVPDLDDRGAGAAEPTNAEKDARIDFVLVAGAETEPITVNYFEGSDDTLPLNGRLSDHAALLTTGKWDRRGFPANPSVNLPKEVRVQVSRLEEVTEDTPAIVPVPVVVDVLTPIGPVPVFFPVLIGCDGQTDHFGDLKVSAGSAEANRNFGEGAVFEGDDLTPDGWSAAINVEAGVTSGSTHFALFDDDDFLCGGGNDAQDINPFSGDADITLTLDFASDSILVGGTRLGAIGEPIVLAGTDSSDRARATLFIESRYSTTADSDGDGLTDADEAYTRGTNPEDADTDDDGLTDGAEVNQYQTNPLDADTDDDGLSDGTEVDKNTNPLDADTDDDGLNDGDEITFGSDPLDADTDDDQLSDGDEVHTYGTSPTDADSDDDALTDGEEVLTYGTDPLDPDTDDDELNDGLEVQAATDPLDGDSDDDGLIDGEDVEFIEHVVSGLPESALSTAAIRGTIIARLEGIEAQGAQGHKDEASFELSKLRLRLDGCGTTAAKDDWIVACDSQTLVRGLVDLLAANLAN